MQSRDVLFEPHFRSDLLHRINFIEMPTNVLNLVILLTFNTESIFAPRLNFVVTYLTAHPTLTARPIEKRPRRFWYYY